jgi:hypothetical protein
MSTNRTKYHAPAVYLVQSFERAGTFERTKKVLFVKICRRGTLFTKQTRWLCEALRKCADVPNRPIDFSGVPMAESGRVKGFCRWSRG